jgi:hypothetical protein
MPKPPASFDEQVARLAADRMVGESKAVAGMRGLPADVRYATPQEELDLFDQWDEKVDPVAVLQERFAKHTADGLPPEMAMAEAIVETCAAGFSKRLKMAGGSGRLSLTEQTAYLERMAKKSRARREKQSPAEGGTADTGASETTPPASSWEDAGGLAV